MCEVQPNKPVAEPLMYIADRDMYYTRHQGTNLIDSKETTGGLLIVQATLSLEAIIYRSLWPLAVELPGKRGGGR